MRIYEKAYACLALALLAVPLCAQNNDAPARIPAGQRQVRTWIRPSDLTPDQLRSMMRSERTLPLWDYDIVSPRDGNVYAGVIVGDNPKDRNSNKEEIPTQIIPLIIVTNTIVTSINPDGSFVTAPGQTVFDPTVADTNCMAPPNDVPITVTRQSPIFERAEFMFGGTDVGDTQYLDAFQRANFWSVIRPNQYHVLLKPITILGPIVLNIPAASGTSLPPDLFNPPLCGPSGEIDVNYLDAVLAQQVLPALHSQGVDSSKFPIFLMHNVVGSYGAPGYFNCCELGYHNATNLQTYAVDDFEDTGSFDPTVNDTGILSHEVGEWMNDPYLDNYTPAWGHIGQQSGCQNNMEVGDPLTATDLPLVTMPNGFGYHLQELAFFSWFFGGRSLGVNGWYSDNGTFLSDAGPVCH